MTTLSECKEPSPLTKLPWDILQFILSYASLQELLNLSLVSTSFKQMASLTNTLQIVPSNSNVVDSKSNLRKSLPNSMNLDPISSSVSFLKTNSSSSTRLTESMLRHMFLRFQHLSTIKLHNLSHLGDEVLQIIESSPLKNCILHVEFHNVHMYNHIQPLTTNTNDNITRNRKGSRIQFMNHAQHVTVVGTIFSTASSLECFTSSPNLHHLRLSGCRSLYDGDMNRIVIPNHAPLRVLSLDNASQLIAPIIQSDTLETLDLRQCVKLSYLKGIRCKNLTNINLSFCTRIGNGQVESLLLQSPQLIHIRLNSCTGISNLVIISEHLQTLDLMLCSSLSTLSLDCASLEHCELGMCMKLNQLFLHSNVLRHIDLSMLLLHTITMDAPRLTSLNLSGCFKLKNEGISLMNCHKLVDVDICETNLDSELFTAGKTAKVKVKRGGTGINWMDLAGIEN